MITLDAILNSRRTLPKFTPREDDHRIEAEGGCGVIGVASSIPVAGRHIIGPTAQMCNRGNGKGGGIAVVGCFPEFAHHYALNIGYLREDARKPVEDEFIQSSFEVTHVEEQPHVEDYREFPRFDVAPPRAVRYFVRAQPSVVREFARKHGFDDLQAAEDEFVYQNSFRLNKKFYAELDDKGAFVLSHGRNMLILKAVGYCEDIARYYQLEDMLGYVWIGHQRYPTRGRVWHPGGAHPFSGLDEALVHNGDFANYFGVRSYLQPRGYEPLFLTDTEVSVLLFDLYNRVYGYPLEYLIEAFAPTTEHDYAMLPAEKQKIYKAIQRAHLHGSPDGPWFFIIARNDTRRNEMQLIGITDTSMLRPQVFALQQTELPTPDLQPPTSKISIGAIASEKQAIDAFFQSLAREDPRIAPVADKYWNARGGSHSDGGAFIYSVKASSNGHGEAMQLVCTNKFGHEVGVQKGSRPSQDDRIRVIASPSAPLHPVPRADARQAGERLRRRAWINSAKQSPLRSEEIASPQRTGASGLAMTTELLSAIRAMPFANLRILFGNFIAYARTSDDARAQAIETLTRLSDLQYDTGEKKRSSVVAMVHEALDNIFDDVPCDGALHRRVDFASHDQLTSPTQTDATLFVDAREFPPEGETSVARLLVRAHAMGWQNFVVYRCKGDRFIGCGLGPNSHGVRIDVYGSAGDYLGSGLDGAEIYVHNAAQDQIGQIMKSGKIVIYGMVGQTLLYGAKGGVVYVMGNAAGRPLINAVGHVRALINGTCLDYCAESFMAGAETGGGFVIINGVEFDDDGRLRRLGEPYPGGNFFSLASGGAGYIADPHHTLTDEQLNEAQFVNFTDADWKVIEPYLRENEKYFGIGVGALLDNQAPQAIYRKVVAAKKGVVAKAEEVGE